MGQPAAGAVQGMSDEEIQQRVLGIVNNLRPMSRWALEQWLRLLEVESVPGCLISEKPSRPGEPIELSFHGNFTVDTRDRFERRSTRR